MIMIKPGRPADGVTDYLGEAETGFFPDDISQDESVVDTPCLDGTSEQDAPSGTIRNHRTDDASDPLTDEDFGVDAYATPADGNRPSPYVHSETGEQINISDQSVYGTDAADLVIGVTVGQGDNFIFADAGPGDDMFILIGAGKNLTARGGRGADFFLIDDANGRIDLGADGEADVIDFYIDNGAIYGPTVIRHFDPGEDTLNFISPDNSLLGIDYRGGNTMITYEGRDLALLVGVHDNIIG